MEFKEFIKNQAISDKLPFNLDIEPEPWDGTFANIARFQLPVYKDLLARESWFFEFLASTVGNRRIELQIELYSLAKLLKEELGIENDTLAFKTLSELTGGDSDLPAEDETEDERQARESFKDRKQAFFMKHLARFTKLADMANVTEEGAIEAWMRITFFLLSRFDADWTFSRTASLKKSEIASLLEFISLEANGGIPPATDPDPDMGKQSSTSNPPESQLVPTGAKRSGKSTPTNT